MSQQSAKLDSDYLSNCTLYALATHYPDPCLHDLLNDLDFSASDKDEDGGPLPGVPQRNSLYLDEKLPASILLKCPFAPEDAFKSFLQRLRVSLDVTAIADKSHHSPAPNRTSQPAPARDVLDSRIVEDPSQAEIAIYEEPSLDTDANDDDRTSTSSDHPSRSIFVLYKVSVHIARTRLQQTTHPSSPSPPSAYLSCTVLLSPAPRSPSDLTDPILPRNQATSHNVLSALQHDPTFASNNLTAPVLTAARLTKHTPPGDLFSPIDDSRPLKNVARRLMRLIPAVGTRLRVSRVGGSVSVARVLAGIDVDISPALLTSRDTEQDDKDPESEEDTVTLESIDVTLSHGTAVSLTHCNDKQKDVASLPRTCKARDILSLVYDLTPSPTYTADSSNDTPATTHKHTLYFRLTASITTNSSPTETKTRTKMKVERPLLTHWRTTLDLALLHRKLAPLALSPAAPKKPYSNHLVTVTVTAPERTRVGATLTWNVLVVNRAARPLRVAVLPLMSPPYVVDHMYDRDDVPTQEDDDGAVLRHGSERKQRGGDRTPDMIPLTPELRFPPLEPGTSAEGSLRFWITRVGALERCGVRVVEVDEGGRAMREGAKDGESKRSLRDLRDGGAGVGPAAGEGWIDVPRSCLPDVVAYPAAGEEGSDGTANISTRGPDLAWPFATATPPHQHRYTAKPCQAPSCPRNLHHAAKPLDAVSLNVSKAQAFSPQHPPHPAAATNLPRIPTEPRPFQSIRKAANRRMDTPLPG